MISQKDLEDYKESIQEKIDGLQTKLKVVDELIEEFAPHDEQTEDGLIEEEEEL
ncbi:MAG: hypothetical protein PF487_05780 [Bacteroidales bacterium]|jgi:hypothetical protein|nr:hypothetical protein [Bacteroidales bacterium]